MKKLYEHQKNIVKEDKKKVGLFLGCGGGKTLTALLLARGKTIILAPKTQIEDQNWEREIEENNLKGDFTIISIEKFRKDWDSRPACDTLIIDEAHKSLGVEARTHYVDREEHVKTSQIFDAIWKYVEKHKPERIYPATATISKSAMTVWGCARLLGKDWDFDEYRKVYYWKRKITKAIVGKKGKVFRRSVEIWSAKVDQATKERLARTVKLLGYTGRLEDWNDVPKQIEKNVYLEVTAKQKERIKELKLEYPEPIVRIGKIHQVENGILSGDEFIEPEYFENAKIEWIKDHAVEFPQMIIFCKYTEQIAQYEKELKDEGYPVYTMTGKTKDRGELIAKLKEADEYIFIVQSQISSGWELKKCPVVIFASRTYSWVDLEQGRGRVQRGDNIKANIYINLIVRGYTDEAVHRCLENKVDFNEEIYAKKLFKD